MPRSLLQRREDAKGRDEDGRAKVLAEARATAEAGAFSVVVEGVAEGLAREVDWAIARRQDRKDAGV